MKNWKTTVASVLVGITGGTGLGWQSPEGKINWAAVGFSILTAIMGYFAKDHDVTGTGR